MPSGDDGIGLTLQSSYFYPELAQPILDQSSILSISFSEGDKVVKCKVKSGHIRGTTIVRGDRKWASAI